MLSHELQIKTYPVTAMHTAPMVVGREKKQGIAALLIEIDKIESVERKIRQQSTIVTNANQGLT
jgi:hypothetical protein